MELFDTGLYGEISTYYVSDVLISVHADVSEVMNSDSKDLMLSLIEEAFGEPQYISTNTGDYMFWENKEMQITLYTESSYAHMINKLFIEQKWD